MTDSAKQDATTKQAAKAEPPAATSDEAQAAVSDDAHATPTATPTDEAQPDIDDVKAKFREALDRKRQVHAEGQGKGGHEAGKVSGAHGPAASRRNFRRKSG
jgi:hypothetical protein